MTDLAWVTVQLASGASKVMTRMASLETRWRWLPGDRKAGWHRLKIFESKYGTGQFLEVIPLAHGSSFHLNRGKAVSPPILAAL